MLRICDDIYYRVYGNFTYVRSVVQRRDFLFNEIVYDILTFIEQNPDCTSDGLLMSLREIYDVGDSSLERDIPEFIEILLQNEIIWSPSDKEKAGAERIRDIVHAVCGASGQIMSVCLELTYRCNEKCIHCYIDDFRDCGKELRLRDYVRIIDELAEMNCLSLLITGGEPTLHPDFLEIVRYAQKRRMLVNLYTNGLAIESDMLDELIELRPNSISFSFYGGTPAVHDGITGIQGSFEKSMRTLLLVKARGIDVFIKTVVMKQNVHDYENLLKLSRKLGVTVESTMTVMYSHSGVPSDRFRLMDVEAYKRVMWLEQKYSPKEIDATSAKSDSVCGCGRDALSVNPYGEVYPCNAYPVSIGNIHEMTIRGIWTQSEELKRIRKMTYRDLGADCGECRQREWCSPCLGSAIRENGFPARSADSCMLAEALKESVSGGFL